MSFSFFGTFTSAQWDEFVSFINIQKVDLQARRKWLSAQLLRNGVFRTEYDDVTKMPMDHDPNVSEGGFTCTPNNSYGAKLLSAYRMLGGVPEHDMLLRTSDDPVFLTTGSNLETGENSNKTGYSDVYSNGRRDRGSMRFDRDLGLLVESVKAPFLETIKLKREHLEFKIKRALDYSDQLQREIDQIDSLIGDGINFRGTLDDLLLRVELEMSSAGSMNVVQNSEDKFGLNIGRVGDIGFEDSEDQLETETERIPQR